MFDTFYDVPVVMPGSAGNWSPSSFDPQTGYTYVMGEEGVTGRAMKAADPAKAHGAILGKAMSALDQGQGMVLVLVTLH